MRIRSSKEDNVMKIIPVIEEMNSGKILYTRVSRKEAELFLVIDESIESFPSRIVGAAASRRDAKRLIRDDQQHSSDMINNRKGGNGEPWLEHFR